MPGPDKREPWIARFVAALKGLVERKDRATLAKLRRGLGKPVGQAADRDVWVYRHLHEAKPEHEESAAIVGSLFALHSASGDASIGTGFARLKQGGASESVEKRFTALLDSNPEDLPARLRHAVSLLKSKDIAIDWARLLDDLLRWNFERRPVQRQWARDYWSAAATESDTDAESQTVGVSPAGEPASTSNSTGR